VFFCDRNVILNNNNNNLTHAHARTKPVGLLRTSIQLVAEVATNTTHSKHNRRTCLPTAGFESTIPSVERPQTYVIDRTATDFGFLHNITNHFSLLWDKHISRRCIGDALSCKYRASTSMKWMKCTKGEKLQEALTLRIEQ